MTMRRTIAGRPRWILSGAALVSLVRIAAAPVLAEAPPPTHPPEPTRAPPEAYSHDDDLQRREAIRRARDEIRRNPSQKKFILFRYGLHDDALR